MEFRPYEPPDKPGIIALIDAIFREYGDRVRLDGSEADLNDIPAHFAPGHFMVLHDSGDIRGTVAVARDTSRPEVYLLKRLYLHPDLHGSGWGGRLLDWAQETALQGGGTRVELWSDVRFARAHAFYAKMGYRHSGCTRTMHDAWEPYTEYHYFRDLDRSL